MDSADTGEPVQPGDSGDTSSPIDTGPSWAAPCTTYGEYSQTGTVVDETLNELSGVAVSRRDSGVLWLQEDHGGANAIYALDTSGNTLATITLEGATNNDWEDIAIGPCGEETCIFVAEIGNNDGVRTEFGVYALVEPDAYLGDQTTTDWTWYGFAYPGDNQNAEALAVGPDGLPVVLTKNYAGSVSEVLQYTALDSSIDVPLTSFGSIVTGAAEEGGFAALTAADLSIDGSRLIFRTYGSRYEVDLSAGIAGIAAAPQALVPGPTGGQGEAIAYDPWRGGLWEVPEGINPGLWYTSCAVD